MRSVAVVFPASMCAMIPMFRQRFRGMVRATLIHPCGLASPRLLRTSLELSVRILLAIRTGNFAKARLPAAGLPAVMRESLVGFGHAVDVFLLLHCRAAPVGRVQQLVRQLF